RFGKQETISIPVSALYTFPEAMPGLEDSHRFAVIGDETTAPFRWLQSLDEEQVCLPVLDLQVLPLENYAARVAEVVGEAESAALAARILLVCRFNHDAEIFLANLLAPIVLDPRAATGKQVILEGQPFPLR